MATSKTSAAHRETDSGSPRHGEPAFLSIGRIRKPHGVRGEMTLEVLTDFPNRIAPGLNIFIGEKKQENRIRSVRQASKGLIIALDDVINPETAAHFSNQIIFIESQSLPKLPKGHYYHHDFIGIRVIDDENRELGVVEEILTTGSNDVYVIRSQGVGTGEILLPAIKDVILDIDLASHIMKVKPPDWV